MEIYPARQLLMLAVSFLLGAGAGVLLDLFAAIRVLLGAYSVPGGMRERYTRPLPLLGKPIPQRGEKKVGRIWKVGITAFMDVLFCFLVGLCAQLILYEYNDGVFRLSVPLFTTIGFVLYRISIAKLSSCLIELFAFVIAAVFCYLRALVCLPIIFVWRLLRRILFRPLARLFDFFFVKYLRKAAVKQAQKQYCLLSAGFEKKRMPHRGRSKRKESV